MKDLISLSCKNNKGSISGVNNGKQEAYNNYVQEYYIHSAERISNYFSWVKFIVTISSGAVAFVMSSLFVIKGPLSAFLFIVSLAIICFFCAIMSGLLSFIGNVKYEESKALVNYHKAFKEAENSIDRTSVDPWFSTAGNFSFYAMSAGFFLLVSGLLLFWLNVWLSEKFLSWGMEIIVALLFAGIMEFFLYCKSKKYLFHADDEDIKIERSLGM